MPLYVNCTLKPSPERSHTQGLIDLSAAIMSANGVAVDEIRAVDHELAPAELVAITGWRSPSTGP